MTVVKVNRTMVTARYNSDPKGHWSHRLNARPFTDFVFYEPEPNSEKEPPMAKEKIYRVIADQGLIGKVLAETPDNRCIFWPLQGNHPLTFSPDELEELKPYTVFISFPAYEGHFKVSKDQLKLHDVIMCPNKGIGQVTEVDTGHNNYRELPKGVRLIPTQEMN